MTAPTPIRRLVTLALAVALSTMGLAACGKRGAPRPPGPADQITWPKVYPTR